MENQIISNIELLNEIKKLQSQIIAMEKRINTSNDIIINHIDFINKVFNTIKLPLFFIMNKVNGLLQLENNVVNDHKD